MPRTNRRTRHVLMGTLLGLLAAAPAAGATPQMSDGLLFLLPKGEQPESEALAPVVFHDARLQMMVAELELASPTTAAMLLAIRRSGFPLAFGTFSDLTEEMQQEYRSWDPEQKRAVGYMAPVVRAGTGSSPSLTTVKILVAVNLDRLDELFADTVSVAESASWSRIKRLESLAVLAHEIVHAYGLAVAGGDPHRGCPDPREGERADQACVVLGENLVRRDIGAPLDWGYGFPALSTLAKRYADADAVQAQLREIATNALIPVRAREPLTTGLLP